MPYDVISIGSATVDVFVDTHADEIVKVRHHKREEVLTCYPLGSKIIVKDLKFNTGGGGTNTATSFSKLGLKTAYLGNVGDDAPGTRVLKELKKNKIDFVGTISKQQTNFSIILDSIRHDRTILTYRGASKNLDFKDVNKKKLKSKFFYFSSMMGKSFKTSIKLMAYAKKNGIKVAFNPSCYEVKEGKDKLKPCLIDTDILIFNREEAALLLGKPAGTEVKKLLKGVRALGPKIVVITDGKDGAYCSNGIHMYSLKPKKVKIVETTGAGDAFASGFIAGVIKKDDLEFAMQLGLVNAQSVVQHYGAKNKLLRWNEASALIKKKKVKIKKEKI